MYIGSYKELLVWKRSIELVKEIYRTTEHFPDSEKYGLVSQMRRAAVSIPSNIAEGYKRKNLGEYLYFLSISEGSAAELETQIIITKDLYHNEDLLIAESLLVEVQKMLYSVIKTLNAKRCTLNPQKGFTLVEFLLAMAVMIILTGIALPLYTNLQLGAQLNESTAQLVQNIRLARELSVSRSHDGSYGIYIDSNPAGSDRYILFQGTSYALRETAYDRVVSLTDTLSLATQLSNGGQEIEFTKTFGIPSTTGTIQMIHATYGTRTISLNAGGRVQLE